MKKKSLTDDGKDLKERIITKPFYNNNYLICYLFKLFIFIFEQNEPKIHKLLNAISQTLCTLFLCIVFESIPRSSNKLESV